MYDYLAAIETVEDRRTYWAGYQSGRQDFLMRKLYLQVTYNWMKEFDFIRKKLEQGKPWTPYMRGFVDAWTCLVEAA